MFNRPKFYLALILLFLQILVVTQIVSASITTQATSQTDSLSGLKSILMESAREFIRSKQWEKAIGVYERYLQVFPAEEEKIIRIIKVLQAPERDMKIENLGPKVNSKFQDYYPVISMDGNTLFFTSRHRPGGFGGEDVWATTRSDTGWTQAINVGLPINTTQHEGFMTLAPDSLTAFIFGNYADSYGNGDIFYTTLEDTGWSEVKNLGPRINTTDFEGDAFFSADCKTVFFVSDRPGGIGEYRPRSKFYHPEYNSDIYISVKTDTGWIEPINLGAMINTPYCERGPLFHPDGRTLFFCSSGHPGLGDLDIFLSYRIGDSWTEWTEPVNIGKEINTVYKDWGYSIPFSGNEVYFSSVREDGMGQSDIYLMTLHERLTNPVTIVSGRLTDTHGNKLEKAKIEWEDLETFKILGKTMTRPSGDYTILLPSGRWYSYTASKEGYFFVSRDVDLRKEDQTKVVKDIKLPKLTPDVMPPPSALLNVFFNLNQSTIHSHSKTELERFLRLIRQHPEWKKMEISGHTCDLGAADYNKKLSFDRASSVIQYLVDQGESSERFVAKGYGFEKPLVYEFTDDARKINRRVEYTVIELDKELLDLKEKNSENDGRNKN
jgi:outer membrane protein OmpA-like peptidoglycan-associated protein